MTRLQSQLSLIDDRVTQLERVGVSGSAPSASFGAPSSEGVMSGTTVAPSSSSSSHVAVKMSAKKGSTKEIQRALKNAGFYQGTVDGKLGPATKEAIKEFQRVHGLKDDGIVGKQTWAKLNTYADLSGSNAATPATTETAIK
ncbi:MAG: peptidoglycan-binding protein [Candidatus Omnitrophica bacterium]|nr:peptidoglycan-binding protein [Candidatus Omnitrophota bacterium]